MRTRVALLFIASLIPAAAAPICGTGTLQSYIALGSEGCMIGDNRFFGFTSAQVPDGATAVLPAAVGVVPLNIPLNPGLRFDVNLNAGARQWLDIVIGYNVTGAPIVGNTLSMSGASVTGDGAVTVVEDKCLNGSFAAAGPFACTGTAAGLVTYAVVGEAMLVDSLRFAPVNRIGVFKDIGVDGGLAGSASLISATNTFQVVPEPSTVCLTGAGALLLAAARVRRRRP